MDKEVVVFFLFGKTHEHVGVVFVVVFVFLLWFI